MASIRITGYDEVKKLDNKLSELSKPVHIFKHPHGQAFWCVVSDNVGGTKDVHAYYSQEYVCALQRESAVNWEAATSLVAENEELKRALEAKDKRIAELEGDKRQLNEIINTEANRADAAEKQLVYSRDAIATWERKAISNFEECATMSQRIEALEKRLATPVRLPALMDGELCGKYGSKYGAAANAHNNAITACSIAIRGAGFKSEATAFKCEGDDENG